MVTIKTADRGRFPARVAPRGWRSSFVALAGVVGNLWTVAQLRAGIRRRRGQCAPGSEKAAKKLGAKLQILAERRWQRAIKGQLAPTAKQALDLVLRIELALEVVQGRRRERLMNIQGVIQTACAAGEHGLADADGGVIKSPNYLYPWSTTEALALRRPDGQVAVLVRNASNEFRLAITAKRPPATRKLLRVTCWPKLENCKSMSCLKAPLQHWQSITADRQILVDGSVVGIRSLHGWDCYDRAGQFVGVAVWVTDISVAKRWGCWEHGATVAEAEGKIAKKAQILRLEQWEPEYCELPSMRRHAPLTVAALRQFG